MFEAANDYFSTDTHYQSIARRIVDILRGGGGFVLVIGDPPANAQLLSQALEKSTASSHALINLRCGPELTPEEVRDAASVVARLPLNGGAEPAPEPSEPAAPLFILDDFDRLSDHQIKELCEAAPSGDRPVAKAALLAGPASIARIEGPALQFLMADLAGTLRFQHIGRDEHLDFLRFQLTNRHRNAETHRDPRAVSRAVIVRALLVLLAVGIAAFLALHFLKGGSQHPSAPPGMAQTR